MFLRSVGFSHEPHGISSQKTAFFIVDMVFPLWWEDGSYNCCWASSARSLSSTSPAVFVITFYSLNFRPPNLEGQIPLFVSPRYVWPSLLPGTGFVCLLHTLPLLVLVTSLREDLLDGLCRLVVRASGYRSRGPRLHSRRCQLFRVVVGLERGPISSWW
jgi:hypothetical protein